ncbi:hypothetical protein ACQ4PT_023277 [Festuca glaucescens]
MEGTRKQAFTIQVENGRTGKDGRPAVGPVFRNILAKDGFPPLEPDMRTSWDVFRTAAGKYPNNRMLGWRPFRDGVPGPYLWKSYKEVYEEVLQIGSALQHLGVQPGSRVGIYGANCPQWLVAMQACNGYSIICVPLYDTLGAGAIDYIIDHAEIDVVFIQDKKIKEVKPNLLSELDTFRISSEFGFDSISYLQILSPNCISATRLKALVAFTRANNEQIKDAKQIGIEVYSWNDFFKMGKDKPAKPCPPQPNDTCTIMYTSGTSGQPKGVMLSHESHGMYVKGVDLFMDKIDDKDLNALRDDIMELKPTLLVGVPRVYEKIYEGLTETLGPSTAGYPDDMSLVGTVGVATTYTELCLEEVPEMGYDPLGVPARGEILIRGNTVFTGYYKNPELTNEVMADGWFHTGDIGEMSPDGILKIIDRKKNIFKLSQGEYVAVEYLEKVYVFPQIIEDIWVFGDSYRSNLVAVVNPHEENTMKWAASNRYKGSFDEICKLGSLKEYILTELATAAQKNKPEIDKVYKKLEDQKDANKAK